MRLISLRSKVIAVIIAVLACLVLIIAAFMAILAIQSIVPSSLQGFVAPAVIIPVSALGVWLIRWVGEQLNRYVQIDPEILRSKLMPKISPNPNAPGYDPEYVVHALKRASKFPPLDAAYTLWIQRSQLDRAEGIVPPPSGTPADLQDPAKFELAVTEAFLTVGLERTYAHEGPTFMRMRNVFPDLDKETLQNAIKAAIKLERDCMLSYDVAGQNPFRAIEMVKGANPGFLEETYKSAGYNLAKDMR